MLEIVIILCILAADQVTKYFSEKLLTPLGSSFPVIDGVFQFTSAHNTGAAWGILQGGKWFFLILTLLVVACIGYFLIRGRSKMTVLSRVTLALLLAGALGNAIDRLIFSYVRDFMDFCLINFPIFNIADSALTIGCVLLIIDVLFMKERSLFEVRLKEKNDLPKPPHDHPDAQ